MAYELKVPGMGESVTEVEIAEWLKKEGDAVRMDEDIVVLDSAKTSAPIPAPVSGTLLKILKAQGEAANVGDVMALIEEGAVPAKAKPETPAAVEAPSQVVKSAADPIIMPAAARELAQSGVAPETVTSTGPGGRMLKEDVQRAKVETPAAAQPPANIAPLPRGLGVVEPKGLGVGGEEKIVPMTMLRRHIAQRLVEAQQTAALLTTFNEIDMSAAMTLRKEHQDAFTKKHGIKLGFMSFFVKAAVDALKAYPAVNAEIRGRDLVYKNFYDIGVAIGSGKGLVVPVIRGAENLGFAQIEQAIASYAEQAKAGTLKPEDLDGGTFTITNGGIYGSLMSTPIVNPPQSGILGMHSIQERPIALNGQVVIRPMMYVALTYDHRIIDGREAVSFLVRLKQCIENPARMLLEV